MLDAKTLLSRLAELDAHTDALLARALASGDLRLGLAAIREARELVIAYARVAPIQRIEVRKQEWSQQVEAMDRAWRHQPHWQSPEHPAHPQHSQWQQQRQRQHTTDVSDADFDALFDTPPNALKRKRADADPKEEEIDDDSAGYDA